MRCGKCRVTMRETLEERMGLKITIQGCPRCGKRLIGIADAVRLQKRMLSKIGKGPADLNAGGLKCVCGRTAKRLDDLEYKGMPLGGWKCKCGETMVDPYQANLFLKARKEGGDGATRAERPPSTGRKRAELRMNAIQKTLGAAARRKGITKKDLLKTLEKVRKNTSAD